MFWCVELRNSCLMALDTKQQCSHAATTREFLTKEDCCFGNAHNLICTLHSGSRTNPWNRRDRVDTDLHLLTFYKRSYLYQTVRNCNFGYLYGIDLKPTSEIGLFAVSMSWGKLITVVEQHGLSKWLYLAMTYACSTLILVTHTDAVLPLCCEIRFLRRQGRCRTGDPFGAAAGLSAHRPHDGCVGKWVHISADGVESKGICFAAWPSKI